MEKFKSVVIKNYYYNYKIKAYNKNIKSFNIVERNYIICMKKNYKKTNDVDDDFFILKNIFMNFRKKIMIKYLKKLMKYIKKSKYSYDIELNYYYFKSKNVDKIIAHSNNYYEFMICCYDLNKKIGQEINYKFKKFQFVKLIKKLELIENILKKNIDYNINSIREHKLIITSNAFAQILTMYKKNVWKERANIKKSISIISVPIGYFSYNNNFYNQKGNLLKTKNFFKVKKYSDISMNKSFYFDSTYKTKNLNKELNTGYVITRLYFLNNLKENNEKVKVLCTGYYIKKGVVVNVFSNKLYEFKVLDLINNIKLVSLKKEFSNDFCCPDVYISNIDNM